MTTIQQRTQKYMADIPVNLFLQVLEIQDALQKAHPEYEYSNQPTLYDLVFMYHNLNIGVIQSLDSMGKLTEKIKSSLSWHCNFDISWISQFPDFSWKFIDISASKKFEISWVKEYPDANWNWTDISRNKKLTLSWIQDNPNFHWNWEIIASHPNFRYEWIEYLVDKGDNRRIWNSLSDHVNLELRWILDYPHYPWKWDYMSEHPNLTLDWLLAFPFQSWDFQALSCHPNVSLEWIEHFPQEKWDLCNVIFQKSTLSHFIDQETRKYMAIYKIKKWWKNIIYNPKHPVGQIFIRKLYDNNLP